MNMQLTCMRNGINGVGIPDLIVVQNAIQNGLHLLSRAMHFGLMSQCIPFSAYGESRIQQGTGTRRLTRGRSSAVQCLRGMTEREGV